MENKKLVLPQDRDDQRYLLTNAKGEPLHYQNQFDTICDLTLLRISLECVILHRENHLNCGDLSSPLNLRYINDYIRHLGYKLVRAK